MKKDNLPAFPSIVKNVVALTKKPEYLFGLNRFVDMFCGIGGFHQAATSYGMKCVFACDVDEEVRRTYNHNYGIMPHGDISRITPKNIPDHDIFFAGFPCQPFSIIGNRKGFNDIRGTLFFDIVRILEEKRPRAVLLENVKQLTTHNKGQTLQRIIDALESLGYCVSWTVLNALDFGLPQKRERILIAATLDVYNEFLWPKGDKPMKPLQEILEKDPDQKYYVSERIRKRRQEYHSSPHSPGIWHENKAGNIASHPYSCALRAGASYNYLLVDGIRRLTQREMLRLQGFPDSFEIICNDNQARKQVGNAVPVPLIEAGIKGILRVIKASETSKTARKSQSAA
jgi:DNA (cytosine-5)-methyltransferase 1